MSAEGMKETRLFVPLASAPFRWFASGQKRWELRRLGRQYTKKNLIPGRRVELRRGYSDKAGSLWGTVVEVREASSISEFFSRIDYRDVIPIARDRAEAVQMATQILGDAHAPVIGFRVDSDPVTELALHSDFMPLVRQGKKCSTVRCGVRKIEGHLADLVAGTERVRVVVTDLDVKPFAELSAADAECDGFTTLAELERTLRRFYPSISSMDLVTIIRFRPLFEGNEGITSGAPAFALSEVL